MMTAKTTPKNGDGFAQKALVIVMGALLTMMIGFFIWLATSVIEIKVGVAEMRRDITALTAAGEVQAVTNIERNTRRLDEIERENGDLFATLRAQFGPLTQANVDAVNAALGLDEAQDGAPTGSGGQMFASSQAAKLMHEFEGCELTAYPDPGSRDGNPWTIGFGATGPGIQKGVTWTREQAERRFELDLARFSDGVVKLLAGAPTKQHQLDALTSFAYNVGLGALSSSTLLKLHKAGDFEGAAAQFARWNKNDGQVMRGLTRRRAAEAKLYRGEA
jgi:lysozyme